MTRSGERRAIVTLADGPHLELLALGLPALAEYAERHGYDLIVHRGLLATDRPASWSKVRALRAALDRYDLAVWIDADAVVVDQSADLADDLHPSAPLQCVAHETDEGRIPNLGVFAMRSGRDARRLLDAMWARDAYVDHRWWENAALLDLIGYTVEPPVRQIAHTRWTPLVHLLPLRWNSVLPACDADPAILHLAGASHEQRVATMRRLAAGPVPPAELGFRLVG